MTWRKWTTTCIWSNLFQVIETVTAHDLDWSVKPGQFKFWKEFRWEVDCTWSAVKFDDDAEALYVLYLTRTLILDWLSTEAEGKRTNTLTALEVELGETLHSTLCVQSEIWWHTCITAYVCGSEVKWNAEGIWSGHKCPIVTYWTNANGSETQYFIRSIMSMAVHLKVEIQWNTLVWCDRKRNKIFFFIKTKKPDVRGPKCSMWYCLMWCEWN